MIERWFEMRCKLPFFILATACAAHRSQPPQTNSTQTQPTIGLASTSPVPAIPSRFSDFERTFVGEIGPHRVQGRLIRAGTDLIGEYAYLGRKSKLQLRGKVLADGAIHMDETAWTMNAAGTDRTPRLSTTGSFTGVQQAGQLSGQWTGGKTKLAFQLTLGASLPFPAEKSTRVDFIDDVPGWEPVTVDHPVATIDSFGVALFFDPQTKRIVYLGATSHSVGGACVAGSPISGGHENKVEQGFSWPDERVAYRAAFERSVPNARVKFVSQHVGGCTRASGQELILSVVDRADGRQEARIGDMLTENSGGVQTVIPTSVEGNVRVIEPPIAF